MVNLELGGQMVIYVENSPNTPIQVLLNPQQGLYGSPNI